jgi:hypothetical protein
MIQAQLPLLSSGWDATLLEMGTNNYLIFHSWQHLVVVVFYSEIVFFVATDPVRVPHRL